jgi:hypothetical protein
MMNKGPFFPGFLKKRLFAGYPEELRPTCAVQPWRAGEYAEAFLCGRSGSSA